MPTPHADFFADLARPATDALRGEYADTFQARALMTLLYRQAASLVMAARDQNIQIVLNDWATYDRFEIKVGIQTVWIERKSAKVEIGFVNFARGFVADSPFALVPEAGEDLGAFAVRTMMTVRAAVWPERARTHGM